MKKTIMLFLALLLTSGAAALAENGIKKKRPLPYEYGRVMLNNYSEKAGMSPVIFDHWLHRAKFTCRLCHVDLGFGMKAGTTKVKAADIMSGYYCGACHNGQAIAGTKVFEACGQRSSSTDTFRCERCHSGGKSGRQKYDFQKFTEGFPKERFGNGINWEQAEAEHLVKLIDVIEGISIKKPSLAVQKDFVIGPKVENMPGIIFSHKKHTVWSGCELCHPEIFVGVKRGLTKYSMNDIFDGRYCGVCHSTVAFPVMDCQRCHSEQVQS